MTSSARNTGGGVLRRLVTYSLVLPGVLVLVGFFLPWFRLDFRLTWWLAQTGGKLSLCLGDDCSQDSLRPAGPVVEATDDQTSDVRTGFAMARHESVGKGRVLLWGIFALAVLLTGLALAGSRRAPLVGGALAILILLPAAYYGFKLLRHWLDGDVLFTIAGGVACVGFAYTSTSARVTGVIGGVVAAGTLGFLLLGGGHEVPGELLPADVRWLARAHWLAVAAGVALVISAALRWSRHRDLSVTLGCAMIVGPLIAVTWVAARFFADVGGILSLGGAMLALCLALAAATGQDARRRTP